MAVPPSPRYRPSGPDGLRGVVASLADGIMVVDGEGRIRFANPAACRLFGRPLALLAGADFGFPVHVGEATEIELLVGGAPRVVEMRSSAGRWDGDAVVMVALRDVSAKARALAEVEDLARQALHDPLTGLPNRALLVDRLRQAAARSGRSPGSVMVMFVDLDDFKAVNDTLGHDSGDQLLRVVADRVQAAVRPADTVCRLGGDEFVVMCEGVDGMVEAREIVARVEAAVGAPCRIGGQEVVVTASVGLVVAESGSVDPDLLLSDADAAMYMAKREGKARHLVFDNALRARVSERSVLEFGLHHAIEEGRLSLAYRPVVTLSTGAPRGVEALLRYDHPGRGLLAAERFIGVAEDCGLLVPIGTWALEQACLQAMDWWRRGAHVPVTVNLGVAQIARSTLAVAVESALGRAGLAPEGLTLDLTEAALADARPDTVTALRALSDAGVQLGIDNWGRGSVSLKTLSRLPLNYVKLDRSVVADLESDRRPAAALVAAAGALGLVSIAEGVEDAGQLRVLQDLGCMAGQGNHFAPVSAVDALSAMLAGGEQSQSQG